MLHLITAAAPVRVLSGTVDISSVMNNGMTIPEKLALSGEMIALGMVIVFSALTLVWLSMAAVRYLIIELPKKVRNKPDVISEVQADNDPPEDNPLEMIDPEEIIPAKSGVPEGDLTAVITAAVYACLASESEGNDTGGSVSAKNFKVVSFKRADKNRSWNGK